MELLTSLGVNSSLAWQFIIFIVCYAVLKFVLFDPYFAAFSERSDRTVGKTELAEKYVGETRELEKRFAARAQDVNEKFRAVYDKARAEALKEYDAVVTASRVKSKQLVDETQSRIESEMVRVRAQVQTEVASVATLINQKLIGKDI